MDCNEVIREAIAEAIQSISADIILEPEKEKNVRDSLAISILVDAYIKV